MSDDSPTTGQRIESALVDLAFLLAVYLSGRAHVISGETIAGIFSAYAVGRFGVKAGKQQAQMLARVQASKRDGSGGSEPPSAPGGTSGGVPPSASPGPDGGRFLRRMQMSPSPVLVLFAALLSIVRPHA